MKRIYWLTPFILVLILFYLFWSEWLPHTPHFPSDLSLEQKGQYGDSFGILNSLFTGLGFAGLILTILIQQIQLKNQSSQALIQKHQSEALQYEETLYRLLDLYQKSIENLIGKSDGSIKKGRDVLQSATEHTLKQIRKNRVNSIPHEIQRRYRKDCLTSDDIEILNYLYHQNLIHLNHSLRKQGRAIETFKLLLNHLEKNAPPHVDKIRFRRLIASQLTYVETSYFFLIALGHNEESELRELLLSSKIIEKISNTYKLQIHRYMYKKLWGHDLRDGKVTKKLPIPEKEIKKIKKHEQEILKKLDNQLSINPPATTKINQQTPTPKETEDQY